MVEDNYKVLPNYYRTPLRIHILSPPPPTTPFEGRLRREHSQINKPDSRLRGNDEFLEVLYIDRHAYYFC